jgi:DNA polymerase I-like protein with 3'-5' exonuclease and polymerase domains
MTIPREDSLPEISAAFAHAATGNELYRFDLASAELWVTASFTRDPVLTAALQEGRNLHIETMLSIFGGEADKTRREYTLSKNGNYGIEYGAGIDQLAIYAAKAGYSPKQARTVAKRFRDGHKATFPVMHKMAQFFADQAAERGVLPLHVPGRYRHFHSPGIQVPYYTALNALVQGGVAEFVKDTMLEIQARGYEELLVLQVHDEVWFEGPPGIGQELLELLQSIAHDINPFRYEMRWAAK